MPRQALHSPPGFAMLTLLLLLFLFIPSSSSNNIITLPGCLDHCGNISIPFPFGTKPGCYLPGFLVTCYKDSAFPKLTISTISGEMEISSISASDSNATVRTNITRDCLHTGKQFKSLIDISNLPFSLSSARNKFTSVGCDAMAVYFARPATKSSQKDTTFIAVGGCLPFCNTADSSSIVNVNGSCTNDNGCCQTAIPNGLQRILISLGTVSNDSSSPSSSEYCNYAFFAEQDEFVFRPSSYRTNFSETSMPLALDWVVQNGTCAEGNNTCGRDANCSVSNVLSGYICSCKDGFSGNPYLADGCKDIDECEDSNNNSSPCYFKCQNTVGGYLCSCPRWKYGDGKKSGSGCSKRFPLVQLVIGIGLSFLFLLLAASYLYWLQKKRKFLSLREKYFCKNGDVLLQQKFVAGHPAAHSTTETARIYTAEELRRATDNYSDARILGRGGNGIVYKGVFPVGRAVAIKKSRRVDGDGSEIEQFINEVVLLSQVIHKHVVRILGCCLETQVPLLVYEYISNGTLHDHIHNRPGSLSWEARLRIAAETAGALAYLHSAIERPIVHRDVKAANILLDDSNMAKVTDFGASRVMHDDRETSMVQGTLGYLDPEYFQTGQLTEKSDVYSFGVVMAELLTGQKPISSSGELGKKKGLGAYFVARLKEGRLGEILEGRVRKEGSAEELEVVAELTRRCLLMNGEERPAMREVAAELERARRWSSSSSSSTTADQRKGDWRRCMSCKGLIMKISMLNSSTSAANSNVGYVQIDDDDDDDDQFSDQSPGARAVGSSSASNAEDSLDAARTILALDIQR